jgi:hypothetical protein
MISESCDVALDIVDYWGEAPTADGEVSDDVTSSKVASVAATTPVAQA